MLGSKKLKPIKYIEKIGSAQCKTAVILGAMRTDGKTFIKAKKSRNHTELLCKYLNLPVITRNKKNYDEITLTKLKKLKHLTTIYHPILAQVHFLSF